MNYDECVSLLRAGCFIVERALKRAGVLCRTYNLLVPLGYRPNFALSQDLFYRLIRTYEFNISNSSTDDGSIFVYYKLKP